MIRDRGVATRYAAALFGAALARGEHERVLEDFGGLELLYERDASLQNFLEAPNILDSDKHALLEKLFRGRVAPLLEHFFYLLLRKKRIQHLPLVFDLYRRLVEQHLGVERAEVLTAVPLAEELAAALQTQLERLIGKRVQLRSTIQPSIIGGVVVTVGGKILDGSIRHRLEQLRDELQAARVV